MNEELIIEIEQENYNNNKEVNNNESTFDKLKRIQLLIKKESSLKEICNKNFVFNF